MKVFYDFITLLLLAFWIFQYLWFLYLLVWRKFYDFIIKKDLMKTLPNITLSWVWGFSTLLIGKGMIFLLPRAKMIDWVHSKLTLSLFSLKKHRSKQRWGAGTFFYLLPAILFLLLASAPNSSKKARLPAPWNRFYFFYGFGSL